MTELTPINQIAKLQNGDLWTPVSESQTQGDSIEAAMAAMPTLVADNNDRDARFTLTPAVGSACWRLDMEWMEVYLAARTANGSADKARAAGWYPVYGHMPSFEVGQTIFNVPDSVETTILGYATADRSVWGGVSYPGSGVFALNMGGRWLISATTQVPNATAGVRQTNIRQDGVTASGYLAGRMQVTLAGTVTQNVSAEIVTTNASTVSVSYQQNGPGAAMALTLVAFKGTYLGPN